MNVSKKGAIVNLINLVEAIGAEILSVDAEVLAMAMHVSIIWIKTFKACY